MTKVNSNEKGFGETRSQRARNVVVVRQISRVGPLEVRIMVKRVCTICTPAKRADAWYFIRFESHALSAMLIRKSS